MIENTNSEQMARQVERLNSRIVELLRERDVLRDFANWVDAWVSNPVDTYSVIALDVLFDMARGRLTAIRTKP